MNSPVRVQAWGPLGREVSSASNPTPRVLRESGFATNYRLPRSPKLVMAT